MTDQLTGMLREQGAAWIGFADLKAIPADARKRMPFGVCIVVTLDPEIVASIKDGPTREYYAEYRRVNGQLNSLAASAVEFLQAQGHKAVAVPATLDTLDRETLWTALPHKTVGTRAGLGWVGKCGLLVAEPFGSAFRMATVLTDAPVPVGRPINESRCGDCTACVDACPGKAPSGKHWTLGANRADFFDAFACCRTAEDLSAKQGIAHTICGICVAVCPRTKKWLGARGQGPRVSGPRS